MTRKKRRNVDYSSDAERALREIGRYTIREWGRAQAKSYVADIRAACEKLVGNPYLGPSCDYIRVGYRKYGVGRHIIYYRHTEHSVEIAHILHMSMDARRHLRPSAS